MRWCPRCKAIYRADFARCPIDGEALQLGMTDPLIGTTVAQHYVIDAFLGEGAMARVYRAHHAHLEHKQFAVKLLFGDFAATLEMRLRFAQEADAASQLAHPNVVSVVDFGKTEQGLMFIAMELIDGRSLADLVDDGPMPWQRALALTRQIALGLEHAHERGLIHRDLKPDNVVIAGSPETARIVDFGIAIPVDNEQQTRLTNAGFTVGTPVYCAPEQTHNEPVDHR
ncbi:MAG TPA: serine/threonine-protein kinase, partial [Kofleriaceae bacterium]